MLIQNNDQAATSTGVRTLTSWLWVHQPRAAILGSREKHVNLGDSVVIICELRWPSVISPFLSCLPPYHDIVSLQGQRWSAGVCFLVPQLNHDQLSARGHCGNLPHRWSSSWHMWIRISLKNFKFKSWDLLKILYISRRVSIYCVLPKGTKKWIDDICNYGLCHWLD